MAVDMILIIDEGDVEGESQLKDFEGDIDILAWSWGMSQSGTFHMGSGGGAGRANFQDLSVTKYIDKSSADLMYHCASGEHYGKVEVVVRKAGGEQMEYLRITMEKVMITSVSTGGSGGEDRLTENVSFNFAEVEVVYTPQDEEGNEDSDKQEFKWDIAKAATK